MPRRSTHERLAELIAAATRTFLTSGYRRAQIADVAREMNVAPGTIYLYVESKEALFDLVIRSAVVPESPLPSELPLSTPKQGKTLSFIKQRLRSEGRVSTLEEALREGPTGQELEPIAREIFRQSSRYWLAIKLIERSALDWPELANAWFIRSRAQVVGQLGEYFERAIEAGGLRRPPHVQAAARLTLEMNAYLAIHRHIDPFPTPMDDAVAEETFVDAVLAAYGRGE